MCACEQCGRPIHPERVEYGYIYCVECVEADPRLTSTTPIVKTGQHKGVDLVVRPDDAPEGSLYER